MTSFSLDDHKIKCWDGKSVSCCYWRSARLLGTKRFPFRDTMCYKLVWFEQTTNHAHCQMLFVRQERHFISYTIFLAAKALSQMSCVCHHIHMSNLVWKHLHWSSVLSPEFFGRNPGWSPMTDISDRQYFAPWGSLIMTDLLVVKSGNVL